MPKDGFSEASLENRTSRLVTLYHEYSEPPIAGQFWTAGTGFDLIRKQLAKGFKNRDWKSSRLCQPAFVGENCWKGLADHCRPLRSTERWGQVDLFADKLWTIGRKFRRIF
jgi:hypothetical protein